MRPTSGFILLLVFALPLFVGCANDSPFTAPENMLNWTLDPSSASIRPGGQFVSTIRVQSKVNINDKVNLLIRGLPAGAAGTFNPPVIPDTGTSATLTITTSSSTPTGEFDLTVSLTEPGQSSSDQDLKLIVTATAGPDFVLSAGPAQRIIEGSGQNASFNLNVAPANGFTGNVTYSVSGAPSSLLAIDGPTPATVTAQNSNSIFTARSIAFPAAPTTVNLTVTATSGSLIHSVQVQVLFQPPAGAGPTLIRIDPSDTSQDSNRSVTITGTGFVSGATVQVSGGGISVSDVTVVNSTTITCTFNVGPTAAFGERQVTVTENGLTSNSVAFNVLEI